MGTFRAELDRLTRAFVAGVLEAARSEARRSLAQREVRTSTRVRLTRREPTRAAEKETTIRVERVEPILMSAWPAPRRRRRRVSGGLGATPRPRPKPPAPKVEAPVRFEVVPHPVRAGRRLVMTRIGS